MPDDEQSQKVADAINIPDNNPDGVNPGKTDVYNATTNPDGTNQVVKKPKTNGLQS